MTPERAPIVVMGVSGSGKTTVGSALAARLGAPFVDADDLHPAANRAKMAAGVPLDDDDRWPWLRVVGEAIAAGVARGEAPVVACSALRRAYRDVLREAAPGILFVHLAVSPAALAGRVAHRAHEFMPASLLGSQLATLEPLQPDELGLTVDATADPGRIVDEVDAAQRAGRNTQSR
jgi:gluconokinase